MEKTKLKENQNIQKSENLYGSIEKGLLFPTVVGQAWLRTKAKVLE